MQPARGQRHRQAGEKSVALAGDYLGVRAFDRMVTFYPFEEINQAMADSESGVTIKPILRCDSETA